MPARSGTSWRPCRAWPRDEGLARAGRPVRADPGPGGRPGFLDRLRARGRDREARARAIRWSSGCDPNSPVPVTITSDPPGAAVFAAYYGDPETTGRGLWDARRSRTISFPRGPARLRLELPTTTAPCTTCCGISDHSVTNATDEESGTWHYRLRKPDELPADMEEVPAGRFALLMPGLDHLEAEPTGAYLMDRHPVTNRQYKPFPRRRRLRAGKNSGGSRSGTGTGRWPGAKPWRGSSTAWAGPVPPAGSWASVRPAKKIIR